MNEIGALFDWDGVVIDSSAAHERSWELLAEEEGKQLPADHFTQGFGRKNQYIIPHLLNWTEDEVEIERLGDRKEELYREIIKKDGLEIIPGINKFLMDLNINGIPCAVGSSTPRKNLETILDIIGYAPFFKAIVCAEDVRIGKPNPEVFLAGASKLGIAPENCVVFEDAFAGIQAAKAGGMKVVGLATTHKAELLEPEKPDLILNNFLGYDTEKLKALF